MHRKTTVIVLLSIMLSVAAQAQQRLNTQTVDEQTYQLWLKQDWHGLLAVGNDALAVSIDFYYLRYRMGIAWYEKGNYQRAIPHLHKAYTSNPADPLLLEHLYYANLFINRKHEAKVIATKMTAGHRKQLGISDDLWLEQIDLVYSRNSGQVSEIIDSYTPVKDPGSTGSQFISKDHGYFSIHLLHPVNQGFSIYHGYSYLNKNQFFFSQADGSASSNTDAASDLHQYYISGIIRLARNVSMVAGWHYIHIGYPVEVSITRGQNTFIATEMVSMSDYVGCISLYKHLTNITLGGSIYYSGLNNARQIQGDILAAWYPLGNMNMYFVSVFSMQSENTASATNPKRSVFFQRVGGKVAKGAWLEAYASAGHMQNFLRYDGALVFNAMDAIKNQLGGKLTLMLSPHIGVNLNYGYSLHESTFNPEIPTNQPINRITYNSHTFTGGLTWTL